MGRAQERGRGWCEERADITLTNQIEAEHSEGKCAKEREDGVQTDEELIEEGRDWWRDEEIKNDLKQPTD